MAEMATMLASYDRLDMENGHGHAPYVGVCRSLCTTSLQITDMLRGYRI
uniref:Uncharacterized protein n=1 Tax=Arundo donax TaxID=35708 RepID=A0A0A9EEX4_ARUDO